jgi:MFS transporter, putative metabolite:H+ symporter
LTVLEPPPDALNVATDPDLADFDVEKGKFPRISARETRRGTTLAFFAWVLAVYDYMLFGTLLPRISDDFGWSETDLLYANMLVSVGVFIIVIFVGLAIDRLGRRKGMMITVGGAAASSALTAASTGLGSLVAFRSLSGFGVSEQSVNATYLNEVFALTEVDRVRQNRGLIYSIVQCGWPVGALLAAAFVAGLNAIWGPEAWRLGFVLAAFPAVFLFFLRRGIKETPQHRLNMYLRRLKKSGRVDEANELAARFGVQPEVGGIRRIFAPQYRRNTIVLSIAWVLNYFGITASTVLGTTMLENVHGLSIGTSLGIVILSNLVGALGYLFHGWLGDRIGRKKVIIVGWTLAAVSWTAFALGPSDVGWVLVSYMLSLFFLLGPYAALLFFQAECYGSDCRGTGSSFAAAMGHPGNIIASALLAWAVSAHIGLGIAAVVVGASGMLLSAVAMLFARRVEAISQ